MDWSYPINSIPKTPKKCIYLIANNWILNTMWFQSRDVGFQLRSLRNFIFHNINLSALKWYTIWQYRRQLKSWETNIIFFSSFNKYKPLYVCIISCFRISVISNDCGFIEPVLNTVSLHQVKFFMILKDDQEKNYTWCMTY